MPERIYTAPYTCVSCGGPKTRTEDDLCPACIEKAKRSAEIKMDEATLRRAIAAYGKNAQVDMAIEEMSELTKALCKERRYELVKGTHAEAHANVIEEIADVLIAISVISRQLARKITVRHMSKEAKANEK